MGSASQFSFKRGRLCFANESTILVDRVRQDAQWHEVDCNRGFCSKKVLVDVIESQQKEQDTDYDH